MKEVSGRWGPVSLRLELIGLGMLYTHNILLLIDIEKGQWVELPNQEAVHHRPSWTATPGPSRSRQAGMAPVGMKNWDNSRQSNSLWRWSCNQTVELHDPFGSQAFDSPRSGTNSRRFEAAMRQKWRELFIRWDGVRSTTRGRAC